MRRASVASIIDGMGPRYRETNARHGERLNWRRVIGTTKPGTAERLLKSVQPMREDYSGLLASRQDATQHLGLPVQTKTLNSEYS
jgi:hypothetical protein